MSWAVSSLFCSSLSQRQYCPIPKWGADQLCSQFPVLVLVVPEAVLSDTKVRSISSAELSLRRELCAGWKNVFFGMHVNLVYKILIHSSKKRQKKIVSQTLYILKEIKGNNIYHWKLDLETKVFLNNTIRAWLHQAWSNLKSHYIYNYKSWL